MGEPSLVANRKTVFILAEDFSLESVEDKIFALGYDFQKRKLLSKSSNWIEIEKDLEQLNISRNLLAVLMFLTDITLCNTSNSDYLEIWYKLLIEMKKSSSLIFLHEEILQVRFYHNYLRTYLASVEQILLPVKEYIQIFEAIEKDENYYSMIMTLDSKGKEIAAMISGLMKYLADKFLTNQVDNPDEDFFKLLSTISKCKDIFMKDFVKMLLHGFHNRDDVDDKKENELFQPKLLINREVVSAEHSLEQLEGDFTAKLSEQLERAKQLLKTIQASGIEIVPYKEKRDISLRVHHFLDEIDKGIFLHLYVPNGRYQEDQLASFLRLFESYMQRVENLQFFIEIRKTLHGQIYEFKSKNSMMNSTDMEVAFDRFESFMSLCQNDQKKAEAFLLRTGIQPSEASRLMTKYVKEYQRLLLDIEHERERKLLDLRQRLESEAFELTNETRLSASQSTQPSALLSLSHNLDPLNITISQSSVVINPGIQSYIEQAIYGDIHYSAEDKELLHLFETYAEQFEAVRLRSDLEQLKDTSSSQVERSTAKQKIVGFLSKVAPALSQSALTVLTAYLQKVVTGS